MEKSNSNLKIALIKWFLNENPAKDGEKVFNDIYYILKINIMFLFLIAINSKLINLSTKIYTFFFQSL